VTSEAFLIVSGYTLKEKMMGEETVLKSRPAIPKAGIEQKNRESFRDLLREYQQKEVNIKSGPTVIYLESVAGCPFSCIMCKPTATKPQRVSSEVLQRVEPAFPNLEVLAIHGQGEPLLADLDYFVHQSEKYDFVLHMDTNGLFLTEKVTDLLLRTRLSIRFSIHSGRPDTYYRIMGIDMEKVKYNIRNLVEKSKLSSERHDFWFSYVIMKENIQEIEDFLRLTHECGIKSVRFMHLWPNNDTLKGISLRGTTFKYSEQSNAQVLKEFALKMPRYRVIAAELGIKIEWGDAGSYDNSRSQYWGELANKVSHRLTGKWFFPLIANKGMCAAPWLGQFTVTFNGDVLLCCFSSTILGNLYKNSLEEIWHGRQMKRIRQAFHNGHFPHECGYCRGFGLNNYPNNAFAGMQG
jgi:radical SAM protein with 4Fe4S-binding SPASM domain